MLRKKYTKEYEQDFKGTNIKKAQYFEESVIEKSKYHEEPEKINNENWKKKNRNRKSNHIPKIDAATKTVY